MRLVPSIACALIAAAVLSACDMAADTAGKVETVGSNDLKDGKPISAIATETGKFASISTVGPDDVVVKTGDGYSVSASGSAEALKNLRFIVTDGELTVGRYKYRWSIGDKDKAVITITAPAISSIETAGSGNVKADRVNGDQVTLSSAGSGSLEVAIVEAKSLIGEIAGSGNVKLAGKASRADYSIAGSGSIDASRLTSDDAEVSIAGSGDVDLNAGGKVDIDIAGSGNVNVTGGAKCTKSVMGSGSINCQ